MAILANQRKAKANPKKKTKAKPKKKLTAAQLKEARSKAGRKGARKRKANIKAAEAEKEKRAKARKRKATGKAPAKKRATSKKKPARRNPVGSNATEILMAMTTGGLVAALAVATELGVIKVAPDFYTSRPQRARFVAVTLITAILFGVFMAMGKSKWAERVAIGGASIDLYLLSRKALRMLAASDAGAFITVDVDGANNIMRVRPGPTAGLKRLRKRNSTGAMRRITRDPTSRAGGGAVGDLKALDSVDGLKSLAVAGGGATRGLQEIVEPSPIPNVNEAMRLNVAMCEEDDVGGFEGFTSF